jgi:predicted ATP-binding protein involved in virulence
MPEIGRHAEALSEQLRERASANLPVLCYYPATRGLSDETDGRRPTYPFRQLYAYDRAFRREAGHFQDFIRWFRLEEDLENQIRLRDNPQHRSPLLDVVRRAIERFLSLLGAAYFSFLRIERPKEVMPGTASFEGSLLVDKDGKPLRIDQLSEGERNSILLIADLARRFALANPGREDPLEGSGIVLIDEIDLHLHPAWQRGFLPALVATFPRCQFLVSTHSPQALSRITKENVFVLENFELRITPFTYGRDSNSILDEVMGVPERPEEVSAKIREVADLIDRDRIKEARAELKALADLLGEQDSEVVRLKTLMAFLND